MTVDALQLIEASRIRHKCLFPETAAKVTRWKTLCGFYNTSWENLLQPLTLIPSSEKHILPWLV